MFKDDDYMRLAFMQAAHAKKVNEIPVGAVIVINNHIIAKTHNLCHLLKDPTAHAEMLAITSACNYLGSQYLSQATLYVSLEPCLMCAAALNHAQTKRIVYAISDIKMGYTTICDKLIKGEIIKNSTIQIEGKKILNSFFKKLRHK